MEFIWIWFPELNIVNINEKNIKQTSLNIKVIGTWLVTKLLELRQQLAANRTEDKAEFIEHDN